MAPRQKCFEEGAFWSKHQKGSGKKKEMHRPLEGFSTNMIKFKNWWVVHREHGTPRASLNGTRKRPVEKSRVWGILWENSFHSKSWGRKNRAGTILDEGNPKHLSNDL